MHTLERFHLWDDSARLIVVLPPGQQEAWKRLCETFHCRLPHRLAVGGESRFHSVSHGLELVVEEGLVAVHDGVRPFVSPSLISTCFAAAERHGAAIPVVPLTDSIRLLGEDEQTRPLDRSRYLAVQTPQVFRSELLREAYRQAYLPSFTDDASVVEATGALIHTVDGRRENIKITEPFDLLVAEALVKANTL
jgi:2-C-methyl-D-erythritol 4-phosphate cytidylyltransferase